MSALHQVGINRLQNLRAVAAKHGGPKRLAKLLGYANASYIVQMCGPNPTRPISEDTARTFEQALGLEPYFFDKPAEVDAEGNHVTYVTTRRNVVAGTIAARRQAIQAATDKAVGNAVRESPVPIQAAPTPVMSPTVKKTNDQALISDVIKLLGRVCEEEGVQPAMTKFSDLIALAYMDASSTGVVREAHIRSLVKLVK